jgi:hypothetical protein
MSPVPAFTVATFDELLPVVQVADPAAEPWLGCESVHPLTWVPGFAAAHTAIGDLSCTRRGGDAQFAG